MQEDAATSHLIHIVGVSDGHRTLADKPYVAVHATMVGKVEGCLFLARRVGVIVAVVGHDGNQTVIASFHARLRQIDNDGQIAAFVLFYFLSVNIDFLTAHDGFEIDCHVLAFHIGRNSEMLAVPYDSLIVAAAAGLAGHEHGRMGCTYHLPLRIVEEFCLGSLHITAMEAPSLIEIIDDSAAALQREKAGNGMTCF